MPSADITVAEAIHEACSPSDFEALVATLYENEGYETRVKPKGPDGGVDVVAERYGKTKAVQCKRYAGGNAVGGPTVRQTVGAAQTHGADEVAVVTTSRFTSAAKSVPVDVDGIDVELVDGSDLLDWLDGGDVVVEDGEVTIEGTTRSRTSAEKTLLDQLEHQATGNPDSEVGQQLERELTQYVRQRIEEDYKDIFLQKQAEVANIFAKKAQKKGSEVNDRVRESPEAAKERASITWGKAQSTRKKAVDSLINKGQTARDSASEAGNAAKEHADQTKESAKAKADETKEKAGEAADKAKEKATDINDKFF
jgi:restriction system protein